MNWKYILFVLCVLIASWVFSKAETIFPCMGSGQYVVETDKELSREIIHQRGCFSYSRRWFKQKYSLWDITLIDNNHICPMCFSRHEVEKLIYINKQNVENIPQSVAHKAGYIATPQIDLGDFDETSPSEQIAEIENE